MTRATQETGSPAAVASVWFSPIHILQGLAFAAAGAAPLAPRATVPLLFAAFLGLAAWQVAKRTRWPLPDLPVSAGFAALVGWACLSSAWSELPGATISSAVSLAILLAIGLATVRWSQALTPAASAARMIGRGLCWGILLALGIYAFEWITWGWLTRIGHGFTWREILDDEGGGVPVMSYLINGTAILSLLIWPAVGFLNAGGRARLAIILVVAVAAATWRFGSETGAIALVIAGIVWVLGHKWGRAIARFLAVAFALSMLALPSALHFTFSKFDLNRFIVTNHESIPSSAIIRLNIWKFTSERIFERPVLGWGFDSARRIPGGGDKFVIKSETGKILSQDLNLPLHPHNQILQIWLELGIVGALIVAGAGAFLIWRLGDWAPSSRAAGLALFTTVLVLDSLSFGAWQSWWIASVWIAAIVLVSSGRHPERA